MNVKTRNTKQRLDSVPRAFLRMVVLAPFLLSLTIEMPLAQVVPQGCGVLRMTGRFGPYDYRAEGYIPETTYRSQTALLFIVESAHFTPEVEALIRGKTGTAPGGDISYTLSAFPNHHRALLSMITLGDRERTDKPSGAYYTVECWLQRAVAWRPDDHIVQLIYASFLVKANREKEAVQRLQLAENIAGGNPFTSLNIGLIYFDMKNYEKALSMAHKAIELGLNSPALKNQLISVGKWAEPVASPIK